MVLRRVNPWSAAKVMGGINAGLGLVFGLIFALLSIVGAGVAQMSQAAEQGMPPFMGALFGIGAIVFFPLLYGVMGFVVGAISAALYNLCARYVGGLEVELVGSGPT